MANAPLVFDGFTTAEKGMNNGRDGSRLSPVELQLLVNGTVRGDFATQRPGYRRIMQVAAPGTGFFQHGGWLRQRNGNVLLAAVINGRFFSVDPLAKSVSEFTPPGDPNPTNLIQGWSIPGGAEGFWIYQDGSSLPLIWSGAGARRATKSEIKPGTVMAYVQGRIWYSLPDQISFRATDLVGNEDSGTRAYRYKDSILSETENTFLNEGGDFAVPSDSGGITAMCPTAVLDTAQGQGPLQVFCQKKAFSVNTPVDREVWKVVRYPIQTESLLGSGASGAQSTVLVNGDVFMRAEDGIRSFIVARRNFRDWGNTAQSFEVSNLIRYDQPDLLGVSSAAVFDNRLLMTTSPAWSEAGIYHRGLIALDLAPISSVLAQGVPHYDGVWTGLHILSIEQTDIGTFMFVLTLDGAVDLWQLSKDDLYDNATGRIQWTVVPRTFFVDKDEAGRPAWNLKKLKTGDLFYDNLAGGVDFSMFWRPDSFPCWSLWKSWEECAPICSTKPGCRPGGSKKRQYRPRYRLPDPPDLCLDGTKRLPARAFYQLHTRLDVTGPARIRGAHFGASVEADLMYGPNCSAPECVTISCCDFDVFGTYRAVGTEGPTYGGSGGSGGSGHVDQGTGGTTDDKDNSTGTGGVTPAPTPPSPETPPGPDTPPVPPPAPPVITGPNQPFVSLGEGSQLFQPIFTDPTSGVARPFGYAPSEDPPAELQPGVLEQWVGAVVAQFAASGIIYSQAQVYWQYSPGDNQLRYNPNLVYGSGTYATAPWKQELWVEYKL